MGAKDEFERFVIIVGVAVAYGAIFSDFVDFFHVFEILLVI